MLCGHDLILSGLVCCGFVLINCMESGDPTIRKICPCVSIEMLILMRQMDVQCFFQEKFCLSSGLINDSILILQDRMVVTPSRQSGGLRQEQHG